MLRVPGIIWESEARYWSQLPEFKNAWSFTSTVLYEFSTLCWSTRRSIYLVIMITLLWHRFQVDEYVHGYLERTSIKSERILLKFYTLEDIIL
jgi:hypothetical protein